MLHLTAAMAQRKNTQLPNYHGFILPIKSQVSLDYEKLNCSCIFSGTEAISNRKFAKKKRAAKYV